MARSIGEPEAHKPRGRWWKVLFGLALLVTLALLLLPGDQLLAAKLWAASWLPYAQAIEQADWTDHGDKLVHFSLFAVLGGLAMHIWWGLRHLAWVLLGLVALGLVTEGLQHFIPGRGASGADFLADTLGIGTGAWLWALQVRRYVPSRARVG